MPCADNMPAADRTSLDVRAEGSLLRSSPLIERSFVFVPYAATGSGLSEPSEQPPRVRAWHVVAQHRR